MTNSQTNKTMETKTAEEIANEELIAFQWMTKNGYDRKASKEIAPILVKFSSQLHDEIIEKLQQTTLAVEEKQREIERLIAGYNQDNWEFQELKSSLTTQSKEIEDLKTTNEMLTADILIEKKKVELNHNEILRLEKEIEELKADKDRLGILFLDALKNAFYESRLTHPMIGFKHKDFDEYWQFFKTETTKTFGQVDKEEK